MRSREVKVERLRQRRLETETPYSPTEIFVDKIFYDCKFIFQTSIEPRLEGELMDKTSIGSTSGKVCASSWSYKTN